MILALLLSPAVRAADPWDISEDFWGVMRAGEHWTVDERFPGTKLGVAGRYSMHRRTDDATEHMLVTLGGHLQWGKGETALEYGSAFVTPWAVKRTFATDPARFAATHETLELGVVQLGKDEPLGIESYAEITAARVARVWAFAPADSPWRFTVGANLSGGFAWAESTEQAYRDVSNLIVGTWGKGTVTHRRWGTVYLEQRVVNGWTFSSPARAGPVSRAAVARFGYTNRWFDACLEIELFAEKRSFNFADPDSPNLYTKAKRVGVEISCRY
jgi:hypothetical protein